MKNTNHAHITRGDSSMGNRDPGEDAATESRDLGEAGETVNKDPGEEEAMANKDLGEAGETGNKDPGEVAVEPK